MRSESLTVRCRGRWPEIMAQLAPSEELLQAIQRGSRRAGWCPVHRGQHGDAFRIFKDFVDTGGAVCNTCGKFGTGFKVLMWINGWDELQTGRELKRVLDGERVVVPHRARRVSTPAPPAEKQTRRPTRERLKELRDESRPLTHEASEPVRRYLARRGFAALDLSKLTALRCHPRLLYYDFANRVAVGHFPALVAEVLDPNGELVALQRIYLTEDGEKAPVDPVKKMLTAADATASGGALRLQPAGSILCTSEGLENSLPSVLRNPELPHWPALSAALLGSLVLPPQVRHLVIWEDLEPAQRQPNGTYRQPGRDAAMKLARRARSEGRTVEILTPRIKGQTECDWNKVLLACGLEAIPKLSTTLRMLPTAFRLSQLSHGTVIRS